MDYVIYYKAKNPTDYNMEIIQANSVMEALEIFADCRAGQLNNIFKIENLTMINGYYN